MKHFDTLGYQLDCSRNSVPSVEGLKKLIPLLAKMGYNELYLYTEDTFEVENEPLFGYRRGRYTVDEFKEIDAFAANYGIELIPCIQTLAHLNAIFHWEEYKVSVRDIDDILLVGEERTYKLLENIFSTLRKAFKTKKINIGMDEAHNLGRGKYQDKNGNNIPIDVFLEHLSKVCDLAKKYDFEPMMWSDMFFRLANKGLYLNIDNPMDADVIADIAAKIPDNVKLVYWDYYNTKKEFYNEMLDRHLKLSDKLLFAGGADKWHGFTPNNLHTLDCLPPALEACIEKGIRNIIVTTWGDNGGETSYNSVLPSLCYAACMGEGITDIDEIKAKFKEWVGAEYDDFMMLDLPSKPDKVTGEKPFGDAWFANTSKYQLFNDCFLSQFDGTVAEADSVTFNKIADMLSDAKSRVGEYAYIFDASSKLCRALSVKCDLGIRTKKAYDAKDMDAIKLLTEDYVKAIDLIKEFHLALEAQWFYENKPHGFDVQDIRIGALLQRLESCKRRLEAYAAGKIDCIPELEEETILVNKGRIYNNTWTQIASANII